MSTELLTDGQFKKTVETGVFLPIGNGGWVFSTNAPETPGTYDHNKQVTVLAEQLGFDIALSSMGWDGYDGESKHWQHHLESLTLMAGLAEVTTDIQVWGTVQILAWHPVVVAKLIATIDQISHGRAGLNVVTGDMPETLSQLTQWEPQPEDGKYGLAAEWVQVARKYWANEQIFHDGKYFQAAGAYSSPDTRGMPRVVCAGQSPSGFKFTAENCDYAFFVGSDSPMAIERMQLAKRVAKESGNPGLKTFGLFTLVPAPTDQEANERVAYYNQGTDMAVLEQHVSGYTDKSNEAGKHFKRQLDERQSMMDGYMAGSYDTLARRLATAVQLGDLDGIMVIVPDFIADLEAVANEIFPRLSGYGITTNIKSQAASTSRS